MTGAQLVKVVHDCDLCTQRYAATDGQPKVREQLAGQYTGCQDSSENRGPAVRRMHI